MLLDGLTVLFVCGMTCACQRVSNLDAIKTIDSGVYFDLGVSLSFCSVLIEGDVSFSILARF